MNNRFHPTPITLRDDTVILEPLRLEHAKSLLTVGKRASIWKFMPRPAFRSLEDTQQWIREALNEVASGSQLVFAIVTPGDGEAVGSTRYMDIQTQNRSLEIGWTWLGIEYQRTGINTHCKYLLLKHAFEKLEALRVSFKTDARNKRSQQALERIGAIKEGTLRNHMLLWNGHQRDSVYFSIIKPEWPETKRKLQQLMTP